MNKRTQSIRAINKLFIVTAALLLIAMTSGAQTYWKGGTGDWTIGANWSAGLPTGTTDALITNGTVQVSPGMTATARALDCRFATVNQTGGALTLTAGASKYLLLQTNSTYNLSGGSLVVSNIVMLGNSGTNAVFNLSGSGSLTTVGTGVQIGINAGNEGLLTQAGTSSMTQNNNFIVGNSGVGVYVLSGGSATVNIGTIYLGNFTGSSGTVLQSGGTLSAGSNLIIGRNANTKGVYRLSGGTLQCSGIMYLNYAAGSTGVVSQTGGDVAVNSLCVARTAYGYYELAGGTLESSGTANTLIGYGNNLGLLYMTGGTNRILNGQYLVLNYTGAGTNVYYASGGSLVMSSFSNIELGYGGTPTRNTFTLAGNAKALGANLVLGRAAGGVNIANLNGGVLTVNGVGKRGAPGGLSLVNFDGGTLQASADGTLLGNRWGPMLDAVSVYSKGATFDSSNLSVTNDASLLAPPGDGVVNIPLTAGGGGYIGAPYVSVEGGGGTGATAVALIDRVAGSVTGLWSPVADTVTPPSRPSLWQEGAGAARRWARPCSRPTSPAG
jgi:hypothetical protein